MFTKALTLAALVALAIGQHHGHGHEEGHAVDYFFNMFLKFVILAAIVACAAAQLGYGGHHGHQIIKDYYVRKLGYGILSHGNLGLGLGHH
ncbi:hypothetical protein CBL_05738 [Carabus blaptoides fortunei]